MELIAALRERRLLAIVRGHDPEAQLSTVLALADEGVDLIEVSLSGTGALDVIARARAALGPSAPLGAGTVLSAADARAAARAGADFVVTPGIGNGVAEARALGLPVLAGVLTPTEVMAAADAGAVGAKLFPAAQAGGPDALRALRAPFPDIPFVPVGGIGPGTAAAYLAAGATAVGVGSPLIGDAADGGDLDALRIRARELRAAVEEGAE
ncbi:aldolase [Streptomyces triticagri]|uniref:Aldolase n=1 Tax=Streptomyces triticagri TaxID=2293568 RepID=A0A372LVF1_9ACTN|nr:bifunctional 4-hydroxy-2-oxoglutarate aldolase/2-dehydro-3-deoxy-phosphogluconate aldolase [Streptomyces triticagri]RFU82644.1 aldolase [Streptomyces triticagri]